MMKRSAKYILSVFFLSGLIQQSSFALAEEAATDGIIVRPVVEYNSSKLRDPFKTYLVKEEIQGSPQENSDLAKPEFDTSKLAVQGIIWGVKSPQTIINGQVLSVGDTIENAQIVSIDKKGITLSFMGAIFDLPAPG